MMKRWGCLLIVFVFAVCAGFVQGVTIVNPDFEGDGLGASEYMDNTTPTGWTWNEVESRGIGVEGNGNHFYWQGNGAYLYQLTDQTITAEGMSFTLRVDVWDDWESYPRITLYYAEDEEGAWTELGSAAGTGADAVWETIELTVTTTAASVGSRLGIALSQADGTGWAHFDNVELVNNAVILVSPGNGDPFVAKNAPLIWDFSPTIQTFDLYFGTENDPNLTDDPLGKGYQKFSNEPNETTIYYPTMDFNTTYYWKIVGYEPNTLLPGATDLLPSASDVASFTTTGPAPDIQSITPYGQSVPGDGSSDPTITVSGVNLEYYEWYKDGQLLTDTVKYSGLDQAMLTIHDMILDDEGVYSCLAWNSLSDANDIAHAVVVTERLMSWWKLDGSLDDSVQEVEAGAQEFDGVVDPRTEFTTDNSGIDGGNSVILDYDDPNSPFLQIDGTEEFFNFYEDKLTVSAWVRTSYVSSSAWPSVVAKSPDGLTGYFVALDGESQTVTEVDGNRIYSNGPDIADGNWHMLAMTYDGSVQKIYVDGILEATSTTSAADASGNLAPVIIGAWNLTSPDADFTGNIDNVKIYSKVLTSTEIGEEYVDMNDAVDYVCNYELPSFGDYDDNGNCKIDLPDFAAFADLWLDCNRIPQSACSLP